MTTPPVTARPRRTAWPIRPGLTAALFGVVLLITTLVVAFTRQHSQIAWAIAQRVGLGEVAAERVPEAKRAVVLIDKGGYEITLTPANPPPDFADPAFARALADAPGRTAGLFTIRAESLTNRGVFAPTDQTAKLTWTVEPIPGASPLTDAAEATRAVAEALSDHRRAWSPFAEAMRTSPALDRGAAERTVTNLRGWIANALTLAAIIGVLVSLAPKPNRLTDTWDRALGYYDQVGPIAILAVLWGSMPAILGIILLLNIGPISDLLHANRTFGWFGYVCVFIISAGVGFLPTYGQSILGGWVFGLGAGFPGAMLGFVGGSMIGYAIAQRVSRHKVEDLIEKNPKSKAIRDALIGHGFWRTVGIVTLIRLPPNSPFALTNLAMASAGVGFAPYVLGTALGMAPRTFIAVALAAAGKATGARDIQEFLSEQPWWALPAGFAAFVVCLGIIGLIARRALSHVTGGKVE